ncbi:MAG: hypothetical protein ACM3XM_15020 [Mycobacterium leprae]
MALITLRTAAGLYLDAGTPDRRLQAAEPWPRLTGLLILSALPEGRVTLQGYDGHYLCAAGRTLRLDAADPQPFRLTEHGNGQITLADEQGRSLSFTPDGLILTRAEPERLFMEERTDLLRRPWGCDRSSSHPLPEPVREKAPQWDKSIHRQVVATAFAIIERNKEASRATAALAELWADEAFRQTLEQALVDADNVAPYAGTPVIDMLHLKWLRSVLSAAGITDGPYSHNSHFYDPDTATNCLGERAPTAKTEAVQYYRSAVAHLTRLFRGDVAPERVEAVAYQLGLALHYFGDLCQPMHAANFATILTTGYLCDFRHEALEDWADAHASQLAVSPDIDPDQLPGLREPDIIPSIGDLCDTGARQAKAVFQQHLERLLQSHCPCDNHWGDEVLPALMAAMRPAAGLMALVIAKAAAEGLRGAT